LVELRPVQLLDQRDRLGRRVLALAVEALLGVDVGLAVLGHQASTSTPMLRAVPAMILAAWSTSWALRSASFFCAISRSCAWLMRPTLSRCGSAEPLSSPIACLIRTAAGGLLVTNVN